MASIKPQNQVGRLNSRASKPCRALVVCRVDCLLVCSVRSPLKLHPFSTFFSFLDVNSLIFRFIRQSLFPHPPAIGPRLSLISMRRWIKTLTFTWHLNQSPQVEQTVKCCSSFVRNLPRTFFLPLRLSCVCVCRVRNSEEPPLKKISNSPPKFDSRSQIFTFR